MSRLVKGEEGVEQVAGVRWKFTLIFSFKTPEYGLAWRILVDLCMSHLNSRSRLVSKTWLGGPAYEW